MRYYRSLNPPSQRRLRDVLPAYDIREINTLDRADSPDTARARPDLPLVLLWQLMTVRSSPLQRVFRTMVGSQLGNRALLPSSRLHIADSVTIERSSKNNSACSSRPRSSHPRSRRVVERTDASRVMSAAMIENAEAVARETYRFVPLSAPVAK